MIYNVLKMTNTSDIEWSTEIGYSTARVEETRIVTGLTGNIYYCNENIIGKIDDNGNILSSFNINTVNGTTGYEVRAIALDRNENILYYYASASYNSSGTLYKITTDLDTGNNQACGTFGSGVGSIKIDVYGNVWLDSVNSTSAIYHYNVETNININRTAWYMNTICDWRGFMWQMRSNNEQTFERIWENGGTIYMSSPTISSDVKSYIQDGITTKKTSNLYLLKNNILATTTPCTIYRINIADYNSPVLEQSITLTYDGTDLCDCYGLGIDHNNERLYFSSFDTKNIFYFDMNETTGELSTTPTIFKAGVATKSTFCDFNCHYLSKWGHTGSNYS